MKKVLVIGLGSMGKRRIRCLKALGIKEIIGFDLRLDRLEEAKLLYNIDVIEKLTQELFRDLSFIIISTPPDAHTEYAKTAIDNNLPAFIEASVIKTEVESILKYNTKNVFIAPSCTLRFHPSIIDITTIIKSNRYGRITNFTYHSGQYLPDWHPWEHVNDFYVSKRETGGGREIVPFELTWIVDSIGWPESAKGIFKKTIDFGPVIEDSYAFLLNYHDKVGSIIVDVAARYALRNLVINMEKGQIQWRWDDSFFKVYESETNRWITYYQPEFIAASGYNKNIGEQMYINEINAFISGIEDKCQYPNSIEDDIKVLEILTQIENSDGGF